MPYRFLEDAPTSDVGFRAFGMTLDECFTAAAAATLAVMLDNPQSLQPRQERAVRVEADALDLLLLKFLEELIYFKDSEGLLLHPQRVACTRSAAGWRAEAVLAGEPIDPTRHQLSGDVKAVTFHRLAVQQTSGGWEATVVLDV